MLVIDNPNINSFKKGVVAIPRSKILQKEILMTVLKTHKFSTDDIDFAINEIIKMNLTNRDLASLVLQIYYLTNTGRFSLIFNANFDTFVELKDSSKLRKLVETTGNKESWPELYDNSSLTSEEINVINEMSNREYFAILNTIETTDSCDINLKKIFPCQVTQDESIFLDKNIVATTIYSECYENVCISEAVQRGKIISLRSGDEIPQVAYVGDGKGTKYCFKVMELIEQLARGDYINSQTNEKFNDLILGQLLNKYQKEIKMYKRFLKTEE